MLQKLLPLPLFITIIFCYQIKGQTYVYPGQHKFGYMAELFVGTYTIEAYSTNPLEFMHDGSANLINTLDNLRNSGTYFVAQTPVYDGGVVSSLWFGTNNVFTASEIIMFGGHGNEGLFQAWDNIVFFDGRSNGCSGCTNWSFGGTYGKWVFVDACQTAGHDDWQTYYAPVFNGIHALFGMDSNGWDGWHNHQSCFLWWCWETDYWNSSYKWTYFAQNWTTGQQSMQSAYFNAVNKNLYQQLHYDCVVAAVTINGWVWNSVTGNWEFYTGSLETENNVYSDQLYPYSNSTWNFQMFIKYSQQFGSNPSY